jgi:hypothetical protein
MRATHARLARLQRTRRRWLQEQGRAWLAAREHDPLPDLEPLSDADQAALESLSDDALEILCAPRRDAGRRTRADAGAGSGAHPAL